MQSTGQTSTQALSLTSMHGSTITYVMVISPSAAPPTAGPRPPVRHHRMEFGRMSRRAGRRVPRRQHRLGRFGFDSAIEVTSSVAALWRLRWDADEVRRQQRQWSDALLAQGIRPVVPEYSPREDDVAVVERDHDERTRDEEGDARRPARRHGADGHARADAPEHARDRPGLDDDEDEGEEQEPWPPREHAEGPGERGEDERLDREEAEPAGPALPPDDRERHDEPDEREE